MAHSNDNDLELFARCAAGFEGVLARELRGLGVRRVRPLKGGVAFFGTVRDAYRACMWSRVATRIQLVLARLDARDGDALYAGASRFPWEEHIPAGATIAVQAHGTNAALRNTQFTALKVKDAVCDHLRKLRGSRPDVNAHDPDFALDVSLHENHATIFLNLSGASLHRRGYREQSIQTEAPLKETLAAGMLLAADWDKLAERGAAFADPMCGSGTLAIEAALIAADRAPGLLRTRWGFEGWAKHEEEAWREAEHEAKQRAANAQQVAGPFVAGDLDSQAIAIARANANRAGVGELISFATADASTLCKRVQAACGALPELGLIAVNPPYGIRLQEDGGLSAAYDALLRGTEGLPSGWSMVAITPDVGIDTRLGHRADATVPCYNGPIKAAVRLYSTVQAKRTTVDVISLSGVQRQVAVAESNSSQFAARLRKVAKDRAKWARRTGVSCYRVYDADLPDYALSVDVFASADGTRFLRLEEHPAPASVDADRADVRFADACALASAVLDVELERMAVLARSDDQRAEKEPLVIQVLENGLSFEVNVSARRDTGLPLDHRATRELIRSLAQGKRFLSVGSYAGAPAAYAAAGGATQVTVVDSAQSYLDWARRNLAANSFSAQLKKTDPAALLSQSARYGIVYCDVAAIPSPSLIVNAAGLLAPSGSLVLTSSARAFKLDENALRAVGLTCEDVTPRTIGDDVARTPKIHRCWLISRA